MDNEHDVDELIRDDSTGEEDPTVVNVVHGAVHGSLVQAHTIGPLTL